MMKRLLGVLLTQPFTLAAVLIWVAGNADVAVRPDSGMRAQAPAPISPGTFEAASVKVNKSGSPEGNDTVTPGRFTATNLSLQVLIRFAYERSPRSRGLEPFEVAGGPPWIASDRFDVSATVLPSVFSVLPQQLGLRLESSRGPVEMLVVDHAEHPTDD